MHDEKLRTGGIGVHAPCHGKDAFRMFQVIGYAVLSEFTFDAIAGSAHTGTFRVAALNHKAADNAVKNQAVIKIPID